MRRQPIDRERGPIADKILKLLAFGDQEMPATQIKIEEIRKPLNDFARQRKEAGQIARKSYIMKRSGIKEVASELRLMYKSIPPLIESGDFDGSEF